MHTIRIRLIAALHHLEHDGFLIALSHLLEYWEHECNILNCFKRKILSIHWLNSFWNNNGNNRLTRSPATVNRSLNSLCILDPDKIFLKTGLNWINNSRTRINVMSQMKYRKHQVCGVPMPFWKWYASYTNLPKIKTCRLSESKRVTAACSVEHEALLLRPISTGSLQVTQNPSGLAVQKKKKKEANICLAISNML